MNAFTPAVPFGDVPIPTAITAGEALRDLAVLLAIAMVVFLVSVASGGRAFEKTTDTEPGSQASESDRSPRPGPSERGHSQKGFDQ
ncbi:hypothetical protein [Nocardia brasiliensis]|uniref:hypothetical protein n=1 Tax=Nocardia brasiliensis TaxID=37326 RepID=UPI002458FA63|nr:hypothetical protein [Nocardia brasiliensis]